MSTPPPQPSPAMAELARARQELATWLYKGVKGSRVHERVAQLIDDHQAAVKDAHAHQLAEQVRESWREGYTGATSNMGAERARAWAMGHNSAADLIDPEVQR